MEAELHVSKEIKSTFFEFLSFGTTAYQLGNLLGELLVNSLIFVNSLLDDLAPNCFFTESY